jgi:hypothetical protein
MTLCHPLFVRSDSDPCEETIPAIMGREVGEVTIKRNGWVSATCYFSGRVRSQTDRKFLRLFKQLGWRPGQQKGMRRTPLCHVDGDWIMWLGEEAIIRRGIEAAAMGQDKKRKH